MIFWSANVMNRRLLGFDIEKFHAEMVTRTEDLRYIMTTSNRFVDHQIRKLFRLVRQPVADGWQKRFITLLKNPTTANYIASIADSIPVARLILRVPDSIRIPPSDR